MSPLLDTLRLDGTDDPVNTIALNSNYCGGDHGFISFIAYIITRSWFNTYEKIRLNFFEVKDCSDNGMVYATIIFRTTA